MKKFLGLILGMALFSIVLQAAESPWGPGCYDKIRPWKDYPFIQEFDEGLHKSLWENFDDLYPETQRGNIIYAGHAIRDLDPDAFRTKAKELKDSGVNMIHFGSIGGLTPELVKILDELDVMKVMRLDGQFFWGRNYSDKMGALRYGGWVPFHNTVPNKDWYRKFPPSLAATRVLRDGQPMIEYYGSTWVQRRDINYMHPGTIQMRDAFLRECLLNEQVFDRPIGLALAGHADAVWWDNPGNTAVSYDPYSCEYVRKEFKKRFGEKYRRIFEKEWQEKYASNPPKEKEEMWREHYEIWFSDPPTMWMRFHDHEIQRWWESMWADAYAGYYAWQYKFIQEEIAPKLNLKHMSVGGNSKLLWTAGAWDYYAFSRQTYDMLGPNETTLVYYDKHAPAFKLALAASNGKPAALWSHRGEVAAAEGLACLGVINNMEPRLRKFHVINRDLYHNAMPGSRVAFLYHLKDGIHHTEIVNMCRLTDQVWQSGIPLEIITERHLSPEVLSGFDVLILPGFRFDGKEVKALASYVENGGDLLLVGDNTGPDGKQLSTVLGGMEPWSDGQTRVKKGKLINFSTQLITQQQMKKALKELDSRKSGGIAAPEDQNILMNILTQPDAKMTELHLVNFSGKPFENVRVTLPDALKASSMALVSPYGGSAVVSVKNGTVTVPKLDVYSVLVACSDAAKLKAMVKRNAEAEEFKPSDDKLPVVKLRGNIAENAVQPEDLKAGEKVCWLRQFSKAGFRRIDADVVADGSGKVGEPVKFTVKFHAVGLWNPSGTFVDKVKLVMIDEKTGRRTEVPIPMEKVTGNEGGENVREISDFTIPAGSFIKKVSETTWTPTEPGRYQAYFACRYVDEVFEGKPDMRDKPAVAGVPGFGKNMSDYIFSRPLMKIVYEDKLPCLTVLVAQ